MGRRSFLKTIAVAGGLMIGFSWGCSPNSNTDVKEMPEEWFLVGIRAVSFIFIAFNLLFNNLE